MERAGEAAMLRGLQPVQRGRTGRIVGTNHRLLLSTATPYLLNRSFVPKHCTHCNYHAANRGSTGAALRGSSGADCGVAEGGRQWLWGRTSRGLVMAQLRVRVTARALGSIMTFAASWLDGNHRARRTKPGSDVIAADSSTP